MTRTRKMPHKILSKAFIITVATSAGCATDILFTNPEALCPEQRPTNGSSCNDEEVSCEYVDDCQNPIITSCAGGEWQVTSEVSCNPPFPACPSSPPAEGQPCSPVGELCNYMTSDDLCEEYVDATCTAQGWSLEYYDSSCNPPPAECPVEVPIAGTECEYQPDTMDGYPSFCEYQASSPCGGLLIEASCEYLDGGGVVWGVSVPSCSATPAECQLYDNDVACDADASCGWRAPGCGSGPAPDVIEGCYPSDDCTSSGCGGWGTCTTVSYDPCYREECDSCAADAPVCIPN